MRKNGAKSLKAASMVGGALLSAMLGSYGQAQSSVVAAETAGWTTADDHRNMLEQLGIRALRPGRNADASKPNAANYDETLANPYPILPDPLVTKSGAKVTTAEAWWSTRRPEIVEDFEREVVGRIPADVPAVSWSVVATREWKIAGKRVVGRQLVGTVDNSAYPALGVEICMTLVTPADAQAAPVMIMFGGGALPAEAIEPDDLPAVCRPPGQVGRPAGRPGPQRGRGGPPPGAAAAPPAAGDPPATDQLVAAGWGFASLRPTSVQADNGAGLTRGIIGLVNKGEARKPDDWGALRAWAWGASTELCVSRYGKAALVAMAFDSRFAVVLVGSSGEGGAKLHRRNFGEAVENLTAAGEYHWMAGNFVKYGASDATFGSMTPGDLPVDAHELIALCAPRPVFVSYGVPEKGDALWLDHQGSFMAAIAAQPVYRLLGAKDLGRSDDYASEKMPPVNVALLDGALAWRQHDGGHTDGPNWRYFIPWANERLRAPP
jgi:hypothetical protein